VFSYPNVLLCAKWVYKVQRRIFGPNRRWVRGGWSTQHKEELRNSHSSVGRRQRPENMASKGKKINIFDELEGILKETLAA
jgi:hypothetical protein